MVRLEAPISLRISASMACVISLVITIAVIEDHARDDSRFYERVFVKVNLSSGSVVAIVLIQMTLLIATVVFAFKSHHTFGWRVYKQFSAHSAHVTIDDVLRIRAHLTLMICYGKLRLDLCMVRGRRRTLRSGPTGRHATARCPLLDLGFTS